MKNKDQIKVLQAILDANPDNTLGWDLENIQDLDEIKGVSTDENGDIYCLNLSYRHLKRLPKEIGDLTNLEQLDLSRNNFRKLPKEIGNLINLEYLDLSFNDLKELPKEIGKLVKLRELYIRYNNYFVEIPKELENLVNTKILR